MGVGPRRRRRRRAGMAWRAGRPEHRRRRGRRGRRGRGLARQRAWCTPPACPASGRWPAITPPQMRAGAAGQPAGADAADAGAAAASAAPAARADGVRRLGAGPHRPAGLQRLRRQQGRPARLCRGAAPRTGRHAACACRSSARAARAPAFNGAAVEAYNRATGTAMDTPEAVAARAAGADRERGRRTLRRLPRAPGRAPERPARRAAGRQLRQAPPQPAAPHAPQPRPLEPPT